MAEADDRKPPSPPGERGREGELPAIRIFDEATPSLPLVATLNRWALGSGGFAFGLAAAAVGALLFAHSSRSLASLGEPLALAAAVGAVVLYLVLRAEESRLARELRTARTGTPVLRAMVVRRRVTLPLVGRFTSTTVGMAAVLSADGDRDGARDALAKTPALMRGGRLGGLHVLVEADLERALGTPAALGRCMTTLIAAAPTDNREADLYRLHVLVKAVLAQGDGVAAFAIAAPLSAFADDEARVYATWLRVWFDLDADIATGADGSDDGEPWPALSDGDLRVAALVARAHGAESLVSKLSGRVSGIARLEPRE